MFGTGNRKNPSLFGNGIQSYRWEDEGMSMRETAYQAAKSWRIQAVWEKAAIVPSYDSRLWRKDQCGSWINWYQYGNRQSHHGWEIDHITPVSKGGGDYLLNLRPLHWYNNASRQAGHLTCQMRSPSHLVLHPCHFF
jgi:hypothetical protein